VAVELTLQPAEAGGQDSLVLSVEDNGKGMDTEAATEGFGLAGMRERVLAVGGEFSIDSAPGKGVQIKASFPINSEFINARL
jgi:two-component system sensor histidine kinase UhpB